MGSADHGPRLQQRQAAARWLQRVEADTNCVSSHNLGAVVSSKVNNLAYYSRKPPITTPLLQNDRQPLFNASKTYLSLIIGDGDSLSKVKGCEHAFFEPIL